MSPRVELELFGVVEDFARHWFGLGFRLQRGPTIRPPVVDLRLVGVNRSCFFVQMTMDRKLFPLLPALDGADVAAEIDSDLLP
jgi:hypothetical protein